MTTQEIIKRAIKEAEKALEPARLEDHAAHIGKALAFLEIAEEMAAADAEALKDALTLADFAQMDHLTVRNDLTDEEKAELLERIRNCPVQALKVGEKE